MGVIEKKHFFTAKGTKENKAHNRSMIGTTPSFWLKIS